MHSGKGWGKNTGTRLIQASFREAGGQGGGGGGCDERQEDARCIRGVNQALPVAGPLPGGTAWLLPPAALSSRCRPGSAAFTHNSSNTQHAAVRPGQKQAPLLPAPSLPCNIFHTSLSFLFVLYFFFVFFFTGRRTA